MIFVKFLTKLCSNLHFFVLNRSPFSNIHSIHTHLREGARTLIFFFPKFKYLTAKHTPSNPSALHHPPSSFPSRDYPIRECPGRPRYRRDWNHTYRITACSRSRQRHMRGCSRIESKFVIFRLDLVTSTRSIFVLSEVSHLVLVLYAGTFV